MGSLLPLQQPKVLSQSLLNAWINRVESCAQVEPLPLSRRNRRHEIDDVHPILIQPGLDLPRISQSCPTHMSALSSHRPEMRLSSAPTSGEMEADLPLLTSTVSHPTHSTSPIAPTALSPLRVLVQSHTSVSARHRFSHRAMKCRDTVRSGVPVLCTSKLSAHSSHPSRLNPSCRATIQSFFTPKLSGCFPSFLPASLPPSARGFHPSSGHAGTCSEILRLRPPVMLAIRSQNVSPAAFCSTPAQWIGLALRSNP